MTASDRSGPLRDGVRKRIAVASLIASLAVLALLAGPGYGVHGDPPSGARTSPAPELLEHEVFLTVGDVGQFSHGPSAAVESVEPDGTVVILEEGFEGAWPPSGAVAQPHWGASTCRAFTGSRSAWIEGSAGLACGSFYHNDQSVFLVFGPFDLADGTAGSLSFKLWLNSESGYDHLCRMASLDGWNFGGFCTSGRSNGWIHRALDLTAVPAWGNVAGRSTVWVALAWSTDSSVTRPEGAFVDDLRLEKTVGGPTMTPTRTRTATRTPTHMPTLPPAPSWQWQTETVASSSILADITSLALDSLGRPWISFYGPWPQLKLAHWDGLTWRTEEVDPEPFTGEYASLKLDGANRPHIAYYDDHANQNLKYARWDGTAWRIETVDSAGDVGKGPSLALDAAGHPCISYLASSPNSLLKYACWDGLVWHVETVDSVSWGGEYTSLALDTAGHAHISYYRGSALQYAWWEGATWHKEAVDSGYSVGTYSSLALDASSRPHIGYYDGNNGALKYAHWDGSTWQIETVDNDGDVGMYASLALDDAGRPHMAYYHKIDSSHGALKYTHWDGATWHRETVEGGNVGKGSSLALNTAGQPRISYSDDTNRALRFAQWRTTPPTATPTPVTPTPVVLPGQAQSYAPELAPAGGGGVVVVWQDDRFGPSYDDDVFARCYGPGGSPVWPADVRVSAGRGTAYEQYPSIATDAAGKSIVAWQSDGSILAQALDSAGNRLWNADAVILGPPHNNGSMPRIALDQSGNWYVLWKRYYDDCNYAGSCSELWVSKFAAGPWSKDVRGYIFAHAYWPDIAVDPAGNSRLVWQEGRDTDDSQICAVALDTAGLQQWPNAVRVNSDSGLVPQAHPRVAAGPAGDAYFVWADLRNGHWDVYAQKFNAQVGYRLWANDVRVNGDGAIADQVQPDLAAAAEGDVYVVWADDRDGIPSIYAQKLAPDGSRLWPQDVCVNATTAADWRSNPVITVDAAGIVYIAWESRLGSQHDIFMQSITAEGTRRWANDLSVEGSPQMPTRTPTRNPAHTPTATRRLRPTLAPTSTRTRLPTNTPVPGAPTRTISPTATVTRTPGPASVFTWAATGLTDPVYSVAVSPAYASDGTLFAGGVGRVWKSTNGGIAWTPSVPATGTVTALVVSPNFAVDRTVFAAVFGCGLYKSTNSGDGWTRVNPNTRIESLALSPNYANDRTVFFGATEQWNSGAYRCTDGGGSWTRINNGLHNVFVFSLAVSPNYAQDRTLFAGTNGVLFQSTDGGDSWTGLWGGLLGAIWPMAISPGYASDGVVFVVSGSQLWRRGSDGRWTDCGQVAIDRVLACAVSPQFAGDRSVFVGSDGSGVLFSNDEGGTWRTIIAGLESFNVEGVAVAFAPLQTVFAATARGVWKSVAATPPTPTPTATITCTLTNTPTPTASATPTGTPTRTASPTLAARLQLPVVLRKG